MSVLNKNTKRKSKLKSDIDFQELADALFVLSQKALRLKFSIMVGLNDLNNGTLSHQEAISLKEDTDRAHKNYKYFQANRLAAFRHLIATNKAQLLSYVVVKDIAYGHLDFGGHKFYVIINKKIIEFYQLTKTGDCFPDLPIYDQDDLKYKYMTVKKAKTALFKYLKGVDRERKGQKKKI